MIRLPVLRIRQNPETAACVVVTTATKLEAKTIATITAWLLQRRYSEASALPLRYHSSIHFMSPLLLCIFNFSTFHWHGHAYVKFKWLPAAYVTCRTNCSLGKCWRFTPTFYQQSQQHQYQQQQRPSVSAISSSFSQLSMGLWLLMVIQRQSMRMT